MKVRLARSLIARSYAFALGCVVLMIVAQGVLFQFLKPPPHGGPSPGGASSEEARSVADVLGPIGDESTALRVLDAIAKDDSGDLALLDRTGAKLFEHGRPAPDLDAEVLAEVARTGGFRGPGYSARAVRGGGLDGAVVIRRANPPPMPGPPGFPVGPVVGVLSATLLIALAMSWWFARRLAAPLSILRVAAERFGAGDLSARAFLERGDELGQVGRSFDEMAARINTLLAANRALLANVSHELRTPLARIRVALELADEQPERAHARLVGVGRDLAELERLVGDILAMIRLDSGTSAPPLRLTLCEPAALVAQIEARWREVHGARELIVTVADALPTIACDPVLARRVVDNLLDNAAKYGRGEPVELRVGAHAGRVTFAVIDRGVGMSDDELARAFTPFWRSDQSRTRGTGGVGLGLALARQIARAHGGDVTLESEPDRGTTATLSMPARPTDEDGATA